MSAFECFLVAGLFDISTSITASRPTTRIVIKASRLTGTISLVFLLAGLAILVHGWVSPPAPFSCGLLTGGVTLTDGAQR